MRIVARKRCAPVQPRFDPRARPATRSQDILVLVAAFDAARLDLDRTIEERGFSRKTHDRPRRDANARLGASGRGRNLILGLVTRRPQDVDTIASGGRLDGGSAATYKRPAVRGRRKWTGKA